jgi:hypothetical protein
MGFLRDLSLGFSAGCLGGIANSLAAWWLGAAGIPASLGVKMAPALTKTWLYPRIVWGGIWGVVLLLPVIKRSYALRGLFLSILPTAVTLFVVFPSEGKGMMGMQLGPLAPLFPLVLNGIWGAVAGTWYGLAKK